MLTLGFLFCSMKEIVVGFRTPRGEITSVQKFETMQIPRMVRGKADGWEPGLCLSWGDALLCRLRTEASVGGDPATVWRADFSPGRGVSIRRLNDGQELEAVVNGEDRVGFLPRWFWEEHCKESFTTPSTVVSTTTTTAKTITSTSAATTSVAGWNV